MKAVVFAEHGGPDVLRYTDVPEPVAGDREVLVRVRACALNHLDLWVRQGMRGVNIPLPHIGGSDIAGEVAQAGEGVTNVRPGDRVLLSPGVSCMVRAQRAWQGRTINAGSIHSWATSLTVRNYRRGPGKAPAVNAIPMPANLSFEQAAAVPLVFLTACFAHAGHASAVEAS